MATIEKVKFVTRENGNDIFQSLSSRRRLLKRCDTKTKTIGKVEWRGNVDLKIGDFITVVDDAGNSIFTEKIIDITSPGYFRANRGFPFSEEIEDTLAQKVLENTALVDSEKLYAFMNELAESISPARPDYATCGFWVISDENVLGEKVAVCAQRMMETNTKKTYVEYRIMDSGCVTVYRRIGYVIEESQEDETEGNMEPEFLSLRLPGNLIVIEAYSDELATLTGETDPYPTSLLVVKDYFLAHYAGIGDTGENLGRFLLNYTFDEVGELHKVAKEQGQLLLEYQPGTDWTDGRFCLYGELTDEVKNAMEEIREMVIS